MLVEHFRTSDSAVWVLGDFENMLTTPTRITADIRRLCRRIGGVDEPVFVGVTNRLDSREANCFEDVHRQIEEHGGSLQHGWTLWEWPGVFAEGEFHAVWRSPLGLLLDVSRKPDGEQRILFAPDPKRVFAGRRVGNIRMQIGSDPRIKEFIAVNERLQRIVNKLQEGLPFGTPYIIEGEAYDLQERAALIMRELLNSRDSRRAASKRSLARETPVHYFEPRSTADPLNTEN
jgi:hypothetical protein